MEKNNDTETEEEKQSFNPVDDFNLGLLFYVIRQSIVWVILIIIICVILSIVYLRYTPRTYEASTKLMLKVDKTTQILGHEDVSVEQDPSEISREIQLMKSNLLIERVVNRLPLQIGYYKEGKTKFVFTELYTSAPFEIEATSIGNDIEDIPIYVKIINPRKVYINFSVDEKEYEYTKDTGQVIVSPYFSLTVHVKKDLTPEDYSGIYYFKFLDKKQLMSDISSKLNIEDVNLTSKTIGISFRDRNPAKAQAIVSVMSDEFTAYSIEVKKESVSNILHFIEVEIDTFAAQYDQFQDSINNLRIAEGYFGGDLTDVTAKMEEFQEKFRDCKNDLSQLYQLKEELLLNKDFSALPIFDFKTITTDFKDDIASINDLQTQRETLLLDATSEHPKIRLMDKQIEDAKGKLNQSVQFAIEEANNNFALLKSAHEKFLSDLERIPGLKNKFERLDKLAEEKNNFILDLYTQLSNYLIGSAGIVSDYVVLEKASLPTVPVSPKETFVQIGGFVLGLLLGIILIAARYLLHNTIVSVSEVERKTRAPLLGVIPRYKQEIDRSQIVVTRDPKSTITEAFRAVRNNLQFISNVSGPKIISTTSTIPGEGKTFVSLNVAAILSMLNKKVIILDFDMRKPRLSKIFNVTSHKGVSTILSGQTSVDDCIFDSGIPNLSFITSGPLPPNPSELILLPSLNEMLEYLKTKYDYVVIDTPPIGLVTDALEVLKVSDYPIYVLRAAYSNKNFVAGINRIISESKIKNLSVVINDFGRGASGYGATYGNNYGYGYGYGYGYAYGSEYGEGYYTVDAKQNESWFKKLFNKNG